jgi:hypothetical protein
MTGCGFVIKPSSNLIKVKVKVFRYKPEVAFGVPGN